MSCSNPQGSRPTGWELNFNHNCICYPAACKCTHLCSPPVHRNSCRLSSVCSIDIWLRNTFQHRPFVSFLHLICYYWCGDWGGVQEEVKGQLWVVRSLAPWYGFMDWMQVTHLHSKPWPAASPVSTLTFTRCLHPGKPAPIKIQNLSSQPQECPRPQLTPVPSHRAPTLWLPANEFCPLLKNSQIRNQKCAHFCVWHLLLSTVCEIHPCLTCLLLLPFYQWLLLHCKNITVVYFFSAFGWFPGLTILNKVTIHIHVWFFLSLCFFPVSIQEHCKDTEKALPSGIVTVGLNL